MKDLPEIGQKIDCFIWGHDFNRGICRNCGEDRRR